MSRLDKSFVVEHVARVADWQREYRWLAEFGVVAPVVAHFNCGTGEGTLGLMWAVQALDGTGLDADEEEVLIARDRQAQLTWEMEAIWRRLRVSNSLPVAEFMWWNDEVPEFLKHNLLAENFSLDFRVGSLPNDNPLDHEAYDLVFCDMTLNEIWWDRSHEDSEEATRVAIGQMARLTRPGGYVAAFEWVEQKFRPRLDFQLLFEQLQFDVVHAQEVRLDNWRGRGQAAGFVCQKKLF